MRTWLRAWISPLILLVAACGARATETPKLPSFPGAEGFGATSVGGRGGKVIKVTNLKASGPGSFQAACAAKGPRIIVFEVSGVIPAPRRGCVTVGDGKLTISGQTAPGAGITVEGGFSCHGTKDAPFDDVIIRFLRFRPKLGRKLMWGGDTMHISGTNRAILDHVSACWSSDEVFGLTINGPLTLQWCAVEESGLALEGRTLHNFGSLISYQKAPVSVHHTLYAHHSRRSPVSPIPRIDVRNIVVYNARFVGTEFQSGNLIGCYFKDGPGGPVGTNIHKPTVKRGYSFLSSRSRLKWKVYGEGNYVTWLGGYYNFWDHKDRKMGRSEALPVPPMTTHTAEQAYELVMGHAGCLPRDPLGRKMIHEVRTGTGLWGREDPVGGLMAGLTPGKAPKDSDGDGMPDEWETAHKLDPNDAGDANKTVPAGASKGDRHKGYTFIEFYINECADKLIADALAHPEREQKYVPGKVEIPKPTFPKPKEGEVQKLIADLDSTEKYAPRKALERLAVLGPGAKDAVPALVKCLTKSDRRIPRMAVGVLTGIGAAGVPAMLKELKTDDGKVKTGVANALGLMFSEGRGAIPALLELVHDESAAESAVIALFRIGKLGKEHLPALQKALTAKNQYARGYATTKLGELRAAAAPAVPGLIKTLADSDVNNRWSSAWALGEIGVAEGGVVAGLVGVLGDDLRVRTFAAAALGKVCRNAAPEVLKALSSEDPNVRLAATQVLGMVGPGAGSAAPALVKQLQDADTRVRVIACQSLASVAPKDEKTATALVAALTDKVWRTRWSAAHSLCQLDPAAAKVARGALEKALKDERREVRDAARRALKKIRG